MPRGPLYSSATGRHRASRPMFGYERQHGKPKAGRHRLGSFRHQSTRASQVRVADLLGIRGVLVGTGLWYGDAWGGLQRHRSQRGATYKSASFRPSSMFANVT